MCFGMDHLIARTNDVVALKGRFSEVIDEEI